MSELTEELVLLVKKEAENLRRYATEEEIANLNIVTFNGLYPGTCIYGQMTGDCYSERAVKLIEQCCEKVYHSVRNCAVPTISEAKLNGSPTDIVREKDIYGIVISYYYSPIEVAVRNDNSFDTSFNDSTAYRIINFLKGETETLEL